MSTNNTCANCGKGEEICCDLKACTACKLVKYCNRDCQIAHRSQHKKACKKRAAELHDEQLFKPPPPREECPICMLTLPLDVAQIAFESCCGKSICFGCIYTMRETMRETGGKNMALCPFCKTPPAKSNEEEGKRVMKLTEKGNAQAFHQLAGYHVNGAYGMLQDEAKANELYLKAGQLGCDSAYFNLGNAYRLGRGVEIDEKKSKHYSERAAMNGNVKARHNIGCMEYEAGNHQRAFKHLIISARAGYTPSLDVFKGGYMRGHVTKVEYANSLREYQKSQEEMKSDARDKALTVHM